MQKTPQSDKFKDLAREAGCDDSEARFNEKLKRVATAKPPVGEKKKEPGKNKRKPAK